MKCTNKLVHSLPQSSAETGLVAPEHPTKSTRLLGIKPLVNKALSLPRQNPTAAAPMNAMGHRGSTVKSDNRSRSVWWAANADYDTPAKRAFHLKVAKVALHRKLAAKAAAA